MCRLLQVRFRITTNMCRCYNRHTLIPTRRAVIRLAIYQVNKVLVMDKLCIKEQQEGIITVLRLLNRI